MPRRFRIPALVLCAGSLAMTIASGCSSAPRRGDGWDLPRALQRQMPRHARRGPRPSHAHVDALPPGAILTHPDGHAPQQPRDPKSLLKSGPSFEPLPQGEMLPAPADRIEGPHHENKPQGFQWKKSRPQSAGSVEQSRRTEANLPNIFAPRQETKALRPVPDPITSSRRTPDRRHPVGLQPSQNPQRSVEDGSDPFTALPPTRHTPGDNSPTQSLPLPERSPAARGSKGTTPGDQEPPVEFNVNPPANVPGESINKSLPPAALMAPPRTLPGLDAVGHTATRLPATDAALDLTPDSEQPAALVPVPEEEPFPPAAMSPAPSSNDRTEAGPSLLPPSTIPHPAIERNSSGAGALGASLNAANDLVASHTPALPQPVRKVNAARSTKFSITEAALCRTIRGLDDYEPVDPRALEPRQEILIYAAIQNCRGSKTAHGYQTRTFSSADILDADGRLIVHEPLGSGAHESAAQPGDLFLGHPYKLPSKLVPGEYVLRLTVYDLTGQQTAGIELPFAVR